jgi:benzoate/toluate 1,2-dioxygenase reductase subunit
VLDAGLQAGLPLLHQCRSGSCGSCAATLLEGEVAIRAGTGSTLLPGEMASGVRLLCQCEAVTPCAFQLSYGSAVGQAARRVYALVNAVERLAPDVVRVTLELAENNWIDFRPGQYLRFKVPGSDEWRSYSPSSTALGLPQLELLVRLIDGGLMSDWLTRACQVDDVIELEGPYGQFFLREKVRAPHIFLAGGTGLAPVLAMLDAIRRQGGIKPSLLVSFGCRSEAGLFGLEELALFQQWLPSLTVRVAVEHDPPAGRMAGTPLSTLTAADFAHPDAVTYICGPPPMVDAAHALLGRWGVTPARIHSEQFSASAASQ